MTINRDVFFKKLTASKVLFKGKLTASQRQGINFLLDVWETKFYKRTGIVQNSYCFATTFHETGATMQPIKEKGGNAYFKRMYDPQGSRPKVAKTLGNTMPGDGVRYCGMGYVQNTGRNNARRATKRLRELGLIDNTVDFEKNPELQMDPDYAALIMYIGMEEGWFTSRKLDAIIDENIDGDEHADFLKARTIINGKDRDEDIADYADAFLAAFVAASKKITTVVAEVAKEKHIDVPETTVIVVAPTDILPEDKTVSVVPAITPAKPLPGKWPEDSLAKWEIEAIQTRLRNLGYIKVGKIDGIWGDSVKAATIMLQSKAKITEDGHYGPETIAALADDANAYIVPEARANTTVSDLRAQGSKTILASDNVKTTSLVTGGTFAVTAVGSIASAVVDKAPEALSWITPIKAFFVDTPVWVWAILGIIVCIVLWRKGQAIQKTRLNDERTGKNIGEPDPAPSPVVTAVSKEAEPEELPAFLKNDGIEHEKTKQVSK